MKLRRYSTGEFNFWSLVSASFYAIQYFYNVDILAFLVPHIHFYGIDIHAFAISQSEVSPLLSFATFSRPVSTVSIYLGNNFLFLNEQTLFHPYPVCPFLCACFFQRSIIFSNFLARLVLSIPASILTYSLPIHFLPLGRLFLFQSIIPAAPFVTLAFYLSFPLPVSTSVFPSLLRHDNFHFSFHFLF